MAETEVLNLTEEEEDTLRGKYLIFSMGEELYGMEIRYITEIIGIQPITEVPEMPAYVKGITNLRGKIIPVMDARLRFRKAVREYDDRTCIIVLETNELSIGLIVDSVSEVIAMAEEDIAPPPEISKGGHNYIKGIGKAGGSVKLLLDCHKLLTDDEAGALISMA
ncbi:CheW protein [Syntrophobotulus glycolicus DSM 8271]|uniref:CheW protein n=1 Tax=Syntrophobotulus glycolicus (strain DSM 8271 / FlGlyR) TaxID=645991 RepID=F0SUK1_SYNGF|nr:chemotaxis protein CheW [Syntrophobotulus glycolicus]ADY55494.1 CheW protein [Syntrophobotulus glycolicus DSM 8271]